MKRKFAYDGYHGCQSHCWIEIYPHTDRHVVIATEADDNPGTSVTNMAEHIATFVCKAYNIPMDTLIWIECYLGRDDGSALRDKTNWDLVRFIKTTGPVWGYWDVKKGEKVFTQPRWQHLSAAQKDRLINGDFSVLDELDSPLRGGSIFKH